MGKTKKSSKKYARKCLINNGKMVMLTRPCKRTPSHTTQNPVR